jgi:hypothetical protein
MMTYPMLFCCLFAVVATSVTAQGAELSLPDGRTCFFADSRVSIPVAMLSGQTDRSRLSWSLRMHDAVVARREVAIDVRANDPTVHTLDLDLPITREGLAIKGELAISLINSLEQESAHVTMPLHILDPDPFVKRKQWLKELNLQVYDPEGQTVRVFETADIPFREINNPAGLEELSDGMVIIGEGLSLRTSRGLMSIVMKVAQAGVPVLVLAPAEGQFQLPGFGTSSEAQALDLKRLMFQDRDVITALDKRLDTARWAENSDSVMRYFRIGAYRDQPEIVMDEKQGWPWIALDGKGKQRIRFCGFGIIRDWDDSPVPRYLLAAMLEQLAK